MDFLWFIAYFVAGGAIGYGVANYQEKVRLERLDKEFRRAMGDLTGWYF